jgi:hypothetical protein
MARTTAAASRSAAAAAAAAVLVLLVLASSVVPVPAVAAITELRAHGGAPAVGRRSLLAAESCNGHCAHFFSFAADSTAADVGAAPYDDAAAAWTVSFADAATGAPVERALQLSGGGGVAAAQYPVIIPSSSAAGALTVSVTASHAGDAAWRTLFNFDGLVLSIHAGSVNVAAPGAEPLWVRDFVSVTNGNGASSSCSTGVYLTSSAPGAGSWPANTSATITLTVDENGEIGVPTVDGLPLEAVVFPHNDDWAPACRSVAFHASSRLLVGAGGDMGAGTSFTGVIASVGLDTTPLPPPPPSPPPPPPPPGPAPPSPESCLAGYYTCGGGCCDVNSDCSCDQICGGFPSGGPGCSYRMAKSCQAGYYTCGNCCDVNSDCSCDQFCGGYPAGGLGCSYRLQ